MIRAFRPGGLLDHRPRPFRRERPEIGRFLDGFARALAAPKAEYLARCGRKIGQALYTAVKLPCGGRPNPFGLRV